MVVALAVLYRYAPDRDEPRWRWVSPGALVAARLWIVASIVFSIYTANFGKYNETYGSLGAVVVLLLWLFLTALVVILGAEINSELERQTAEDTTEGREEPMGRRGAYAADTVGETAEQVRAERAEHGRANGGDDRPPDREPLDGLPSVRTVGASVRSPRSPSACPAAPSCAVRRRRALGAPARPDPAAGGSQRGGMIGAAALVLVAVSAPATGALGRSASGDSVVEAPATTAARRLAAPPTAPTVTFVEVASAAPPMPARVLEASPALAVDSAPSTAAPTSAADWAACGRGGGERRPGSVGPSGARREPIARPITGRGASWPAGRAPIAVPSTGGDVASSAPSPAPAPTTGGEPAATRPPSPTAPETESASTRTPNVPAPADDPAPASTATATTDRPTSTSAPADPPPATAAPATTDAPASSAPAPSPTPPPSPPPPPPPPPTTDPPTTTSPASSPPPAPADPPVDPAG